MILEKWTGRGVKPDVAAEVVDCIINHAKNIDQQVRKSIYKIIVELIANVTNHAYPKNNQSKPYDEWEIRLEQKSIHSLSITVQDSGITIPVSIYNKLTISESDSSQIKRIVSDDGLLINEAVSSNVQGANSFRGKGLKSIVALVDSNHIKAFNIISRKGSFGYSAKKTVHISTSENNVFKGSSVEVEIEVSRSTQ